MRWSISLVALCMLASSNRSAGQTTYAAGRDTMRYREVTETDIRVTTPQGEIPMKGNHVATVGFMRLPGDTAKAWYEALDVSMTGPQGDQRPATAEVLRSPFTLHMDARGRVRLISAPTFPASFEGITDLTHQFDDFFVRLPAQSLRLGLAWQDTSTMLDSTADKSIWRRAIARYRVERDTVVAGTPAFVISVKQTVTMRSDAPVPSQGAHLHGVHSGTDDGIAVFAPSTGRLLGRRRTGGMSGDLTMTGPRGQATIKQSFAYKNSLDALP